MGSAPGDSIDGNKMAATIEEQRQQLFKASAIVDMCKHACASQYEGFDVEQLALALQVVDDLVNAAASMLEQFAQDAAEAATDSN